MITKEQYEKYKSEADLIKAENKELRKQWNKCLNESIKLERKLESNSMRLNTVELFIFSYEKQGGKRE